jgi:nucleoside-diphosphate-sugar epimerase
MMDRGRAKRTYCYARDAVEIMWQILLNGKEPIYNVGGFSSTTIAKLAQKIAKDLKVKVIMPKEEKKLQGAPDDVRLDMSKTAKEFGKNKKDFVSLDQGLKNTIEWYKELHRNN